nr:chaperone protein DnaK 2-like [Quercus suber]
MASSTSAQFRITPPPLPAGYSGKLNLASVSSKAFFFGHKTTAFYPKLRAKSVVLRVINEKVDGVDLETTNWARGSELMHALNMKMGPHGQQIPPLCRGVDVSPLSLGLETLGGVMIIPRNTTLPTSKSEVFSTAVDGQTNVKINVFIGEREFAWDNRYVCSFILNIPPAPRGVPQIEVKFCINSDGILSVTAVDKGTGENLGIGIINLHNRKSMRRMVIEAERFVKDYKEKRDAIDTKNEAESVVYQTEKQLKELGETRNAKWRSPQAAVIPNFHLPMRCLEVKNRTSTDDIKALRLISAIATPYLSDGRFDLEAYDDLVNMQIVNGAEGIIVGGTTGEGQLMSWDEHIMLLLNLEL